MESDNPTQRYRGNNGSVAAGPSAGRSRRSRPAIRTPFARCCAVATPHADERHSRHDMAATHAHDITTTFEEFLDAYYREAIGELARRYPKDQRSLHVDWFDLFRFDADLAEEFRADPDEIQPYLTEALGQYDLAVDVDLSDAHVRVHIPPEDDRRLSVTGLRSDHHSEFVAVHGQVSKTSAVAPEPETVVFECERCGVATEVPQVDVSTGVTEPNECIGCERDGPYRVDYDDSVFRDHQFVRLQEPPEDSATGSGRHIDVHVRDDLVESVQPGDRVTVSGVYRLGEPDRGSSTFETWIEGHAVDIEDSEYEDVDIEPYRDRIERLAAGEEGDPYELLVESLAPKITNQPTIKLALVLQLFGGNRVTYATGETDRGDSHVLLVGEPGCGKSTLLNAVGRIAPKASSASGKGASKAGMTAAAVADDFGDTEWGLDAGALVLADKGVACIDEIDKVPGDVTASLHDALEDQVVHINKAGINATLPTRCAALAAGNPKHGRFDDHTALAEQIDLGPTLLSRFDLVFLLEDDPDEETDRRVVDHILDYRQAGLGDTEAAEAAEPPIDAETFRAWIALAKQTVAPTTPDSVKAMIRDSFVTLRNARDDDDPVPVTYRVSEAIQRLAEASARVRLSETVTEADAERAQRLVGQSLQQVGVDPETGELDADIVETGTSTSQRERMALIKEAIDELARESEGREGAAKGDVIEVVGAQGIDADDVEHAIQKLKDQRDVYEPAAGGLKVI